MKAIYLDNAATTPMLPEVVEVMQQSMLTNFGNPSSVHQFGRKAKVVIEKARKNIAKHFNVIASEIIFTSSGTEANNLVLHNAVTSLGVKRIVTSKIEHHAVLHVVESLQEKYDVEVVYVNLDEFGQVDLNDLESILKEPSLKTLVSLMMVNKISIDFMVASAHKFHGPKGVGFVYANRKNHIKPIFYGGGQERGVRSGTENVHAIIGMEEALRISYENLINEQAYILSLKKYFINNIQAKFKNVFFNGLSSDYKLSTYTLVSLNLPIKDNMLLFNLDLAGIAVSSGSACSSGAPKGSHVLQEVLNENINDNLSVRFSFSKMNTLKELDEVLVKLESFLG